MIVVSFNVFWKFLWLSTEFFYGLNFGPGSFWVLFEALGIFVAFFLTHTHTHTHWTLKFYGEKIQAFKFNIPQSYSGIEQRRSIYNFCLN